MAFWNRKKETTVNSLAELEADPSLLIGLQEQIRLLRESIDRDAAGLVRSNQDLCKALNNVAKEVKRFKS